MIAGKKILWERIGSTGIWSLPGDRGNYLESPDFVDFENLKDHLSEEGLKALLIKGTGRHFSAGADLVKLKQLARDEKVLFEKMSAGKALLKWIEESTVPVVAAINGACFGGGLEIALACHIRICSENALFAFPEINFGILPGLGGTQRLTELIGLSRSTKMILSGNIFNSEKALEWGLVDKIVPSSELLQNSLDFINKMTSDREIDVIRSVMRSIHNSFRMERERALEEETKMFCALAVRNIKGNTLL